MPQRQPKIPARILASLFMAAASITIGIALSLLLLTEKNRDLIVAGELYLPPELVEYAQNNQTLFIVIYQNTHSRALAVMKEFITVKSTKKTRKEGYKRFFAVTLPKLEYMYLPGTTNEPHPENVIRELLQAETKTSLMIKIRLDRDGQGGPDRSGDVMSKRIPFYPGQSNLPVTVNKKWFE
ncbi:MAG: hypothetical protein OXC40_02655 [Proteobacteria bacterium]|nr:hypothetical protein [Pseudomonadota bacterium]